MPAAEAEASFTVLPTSVGKTSDSELNRPTERPWRAPRQTLLILKDGQGYVVSNYWIEAGQLVYVGSDGTRQALPPGELDYPMTVRLNWERGVPFVLRPNATEP